MNGHTTQLGPHPGKSSSVLFSKPKTPFIHFKENREHVLILFILFIFSVNIALAFANFYAYGNIIDSLPTPSFMASLLNFWSF